MIKLLTKSEDYYRKKKDKILKRFTFFLTSFKADLIKKIGKEETNKIINEFHQVYDSYLAKVPYIGGDKNIFSRNVAYSSPAIVFWKLLKTKGWSIDQFAPIYLHALKRFTRKEYAGLKGRIKGFFQRLIIRKTTLKWLFKKYKKFSEKYPKSFIFIFVSDKGEDFDFGYNVLRCTIVEFGKLIDATEILPYICMYDWYRAYYSKSGLRRSQTLAEGDDYCDYRFKKGAAPKNLQKTQIPEPLKPGR
ncbi:MAG: hypothetical protein GF308_21680 [Candidatus Heimdallarchaeota archaeon]|nr:hypothetical protein [Candidatus Heimdallarchaeota archaeon]